MPINAKIENLVPTQQIVQNVIAPSSDENNIDNEQLNELLGPLYIQLNKLETKVNVRVETARYEPDIDSLNKKIAALETEIQMANATCNDLAKLAAQAKVPKKDSEKWNNASDTSNKLQEELKELKDEITKLDLPKTKQTATLI